MCVEVGVEVEIENRERRTRFEAQEQQPAERERERERERNAHGERVVPVQRSIYVSSLSGIWYIAIDIAVWCCVVYSEVRRLSSARRLSI